MMDKNEVYALLNANLAFHLATVEEGQPRVRGMMLYRADENGILFHTSSRKNLYRQITNNPNVEMCFNDFKNGVQVRVRGTLEEVKDIALKDEITEHPTRKFLKDWKESGQIADFYNEFSVFRLRGGSAYIWTMATNFASKEPIAL